jgi:hypothetical protein
MYKSIDRVIEWFEGENMPYFVVVSKDGVISRNTTMKTISDASDHLRKVLSRLEDDTMGLKYTIYIFSTPQKGKLKKDDADGLANLVFERKYAESSGREYTPYNQILQTIEAQNKVLLELSNRVNLIEAVEESEEEEEVEQSMVGNVLNGIVNNPEVQGAIAGFVTNAISNMNLFGKNNAPVAVAGVPETKPHTEEEKIASAITILYEHDKTLGDDLLKLANIAATKPDQFKMLLSMLRTF